MHVVSVVAEPRNQSRLPHKVGQSPNLQRQKGQAILVANKVLQVGKGENALGQDIQLGSATFEPRKVSGKFSRPRTRIAPGKSVRKVLRCAGARNAPKHRVKS